MPSARTVGWAQLKVGLLALVSLFILAVLIFLITGERSLFAAKSELYTYLDDSAALASGSPVRLSGILIGNVRNIELTGSTERRRAVRITLSVERNMLPYIPVDSMVALTAENVLGARFINIRQGQSEQWVQPGAELQSQDTHEFDEVVASSYALLTALRGILQRVDAIVGDIEEGKGSLGRFIVDPRFYDQLTATVTEAQKVTQAVARGEGTLGKLLYEDAIYDDLRRTMQRLDTIAASLEQGEGTAGRFLKDPALYDETRSTVAELRTMLNDLNAGRGTVGRLLKDEQLYGQVNQTLSGVNSMVDRINTGQGTIGQLMVNPNMYESLHGATQELQELVRDIRTNPAKFLRIRVSIF